MFTLQVISAFVVGGSFVAGISFLVEKSPRSLRGIILGFPSTMAVSFVFLAITLDPEAIHQSLPGVQYSLLGAILFAFSFSVVAQKFSSITPERKWPVIPTLLAAASIWLIFAICTSYLPQRLSISLPVLLLGIFSLQTLFSRYANQFPVCSSPPQIRVQELFFRALFCGTIIAGALITSRLLGPYWGALVGGTFPASFGSQLMIFQFKYPTRFIPSVIKTVPLGVLNVSVYSIVVAYSYPKLGITLGTILGFSASALMAFSLATITKEKAPGLSCEQGST